MSILGSLIAIAAALAFIAVGALIWWGVQRALRYEIDVSFHSASSPPGRRALTVLAIILPATGAALLALLGAGRIVLVALGMG